MIWPRNTGYTTRQLKEAPQGAVFIWCNGHLSYPKLLAHELGRKDIHILPPLALRGPLSHIRALRPLAVIVDHAAILTASDWENVFELRATTGRPSTC